MAAVRRWVVPAGVVVALVLASGLACAPVREVLAHLSLLHVLVLCAAASALWVLLTALRMVVEAVRALRPPPR